MTSSYPFKKKISIQIPSAFWSRAKQLIGNGIVLVAIHFITLFKNTIEGCKNVYFYYRHVSYFKIDVSLLLLYLFRNPYRLSKDSYGETYLTTIHKIAKECQILSSDCVYELGCGRGRLLFWLAHFTQCTAVGIEKISLFVNKCESIKKRFQIDRVHIRQEDMLQSDLSGASVIYFYGTSFSDESITALKKKLDQVKKGTKVITVSFPLSDYGSNAFKLKKHFEARYPWGKAEIFLQIKT